MATETNMIKELVGQFAKADNDYNAEKLLSLTDGDFQFLMASKDGKSVDKIPRSAFIGGIKAKKLGGHNKKLTIERVNVAGNIANVYFTQKGEKFGFHHFADLIKVDGEWKFVSTTAHMEFYSQ